MTLNFDKRVWQKVSLGNCCDFQRGVTYSTEDEVLSGGLKILRANNINVETSKLSLSNLRLIRADARVKDSQKVSAGNILICMASGSLDHLGKIAFSEFDTEMYAGGFMGLIKPMPSKIDPYFNFCRLQSEKFSKFIEEQRAGTNIQNLKFSTIKEFEFLLPPITVQKEISEVFKNIDGCLLSLSIQKSNLKKFWISLVNGITSNNPKLGNYYKEGDLRTVFFSQAAKKIMRKIDPITSGIERIVAGENLGSEDLKIRTWQRVGEGYLGPAFHVHFKSGDILYGSRRTYLKKVAYADFEGVCSNTTYVIQANQEILLQDYLKYVMLSESFTEYSIGVSKGSTNPYINWKDLNDYYFKIPDLKIQREVCNFIDKALNLLEIVKQQESTVIKLKKQLMNEVFDD
jgi:restriction endonuclease S subunit